MPGQNTDQSQDNNQNTGDGQNNQNENNSQNNATNQASNSNDEQGDKGNKTVEQLVAERVDAELGKIKQNLDKAYKARDDALAEVEKHKIKERDLEIQKLEQEGKLKEAAELRVADTNKKLEEANKRIVELTRDTEVKSILQGLEFRSKSAAEMATKEITAQLVQDANGSWVHKSGISISEFVDKFSKDDDQQFLFKPKANSGAGTGGTSSSTQQTNSQQKSLFALSQAEVLKMAAEGRFGSVNPTY